MRENLELTLAHQELRQLWNKNTDVASAVISNPCTRICFRLGDFDAQKLRDGFSYFDAQDLQNLGTGEVICRIERAEYDFNLKTSPPPQIETDHATKRRNRILELSHVKYGRSRAEVEEELARKRMRFRSREPGQREHETGYQKQPHETLRVQGEYEPILSTQPPQFLTFSARQSVFATSFIKICLLDPVPNGLGRWLKLATELLRRPAGSYQLHHPSSILRWI